MKFVTHICPINNHLTVFLFNLSLSEIQGIKNIPHWGRNIVCMRFFFDNFFVNALKKHSRAHYKDIFFLTLYKYNP
jgi:hypothetical protein